MAENYDFETQEIAREMYVLGGYSLAKIAELLDIGYTTIQRWAGGDGIDRHDPSFLPWKKQQKQYQQNAIARKLRIVELENTLLKRALDDPASQNIYSLARFLEVTKETPKELPSPGIRKKIDTPEKAIDALQQMIAEKVAFMSSQPEKKASDITKDIQSALGLIEKLKAETSPEKKKKSPESDAKKRERLISEVNNILGVE